VRTLTPPLAAAPLEWREREGAVWIEAALDGARAVFSTRLGGFSEGAYSRLNLGILTDDDSDRVQRNRDLLASALGREPGGFAIGLQVHGSDLLVHERAPAPSPYAVRGTELAQVDGHLTGSPDVTPLVLVADCVPVVLSAAGAIGAVHCGWRGVAAGIVERALDVVCELAASSPPAVTAVLGPAIGACCYEVGADVAERFRGRGLGEALTRNRLDLPGAIEIALTRAGLESGSVLRAGLCTSCHPELFFSHRRDGGVTGRQAGVAWLDG
jgi:YfiH family protein